MKKLFALLSLLIVTTHAQVAFAWTVPDYGWLWFTGTTEQLTKIHAAIDVAAGLHAPSTMLQPPFGMGAVDCLDAHYWPGQGPYDGSEDYLGMSVVVGNEIVEIPALEDLVSVHTMPGACYGYMYYMWCVETGFGDMVCPDPEPAP